MRDRYLFDDDDYCASRGLISRTTANILKRRESFDFLTPALLDALRHTAAETGEDTLEAAVNRVLPGADGPDDAGRQALVSVLEGVWQRSRTEPRIAAILHNTDLVGAALGLGDLEREVLFLRLACEADRTFSRLADALRERLPSVVDTVACLAGATPAALRRVLAPDAPLRQAGILTLRAHSEDFTMGLVLLDRFSIFAAERFQAIDDVSQVLLGPPLKARLDMEAFAHVEGAPLAAKVLQGALAAGEPGVNILLYGPPGTGKTELARSLAAQAGVALHAVGESDQEGDEPTRGERLGEHKLFQHILSLRGDGLCLFDEAEDLFSFSPFANSTGSKVFMNRLFEKNPVPVIWIANDLPMLSPTVRRRITLALEVPMPPAGRRAAILADLARTAERPMPDADLQRLMRDVSVTPGVTAKAMQATRLAQGDFATLKTVTRGLAQVLQDGVPLTAKQRGEARPFLPALCNANMDLADLADRLAKSGGRASFCLHGASGTGKSAYARYLADRLGMTARVLRGSDLLSPYVGQTEQQIRQAFDTAERDGAFLILDEVDSFLTSRTEAQRSWELTKVNELLTAMEAHPLPFAVTTNLADRLDSAARRRLDFHIRFDPLTPDQAKACWRHFLPGDPPAGLARLSGLTPAQFEVVRRKAALLGQSDDAAALLRHLAEEASPDHGGMIGFRAPVTAA